MIPLFRTQYSSRALALALAHHQGGGGGGVEQTRVRVVKLQTDKGG